jgi:hypothetical protein
MTPRDELLDLAIAAHDRWMQLVMALTDHVPNFQRQRVIEVTQQMTGVVRDVMKTVREEQE